METEEQKKMRLGKRNARDRARLISQMPVDKKIRLEKRKVTLANESCELRDARLEHKDQANLSLILFMSMAKLMSTLIVLTCMYIYIHYRNPPNLSLQLEIQPERKKSLQHKQNNQIFCSDRKVFRNPLPISYAN